MGDPGFVPGLISVGLQMTIDQIIRHINIALRCREVLAVLKDKLIRIEPIIEQIQHCRLALNQHKDEASAVNKWLKELQILLREASEIVHQCTIPRWDLVSQYKTTKRINTLIANIDKYVRLSPLVNMVQAQEQTRRILEGQKQINQGIEALACTSGRQGAHDAPRGAARNKLIDESFVVGQDKTFAIIEKWVTEDVEAKSIGVLGKGGSGKSLLLKRLFNSEKVSNHFSDGFSLWLTVSVSQSRTVKSLRDELCTQITLQKNVALGKNMDEDGVKIWLNESLQQSSRFALFVDDVWEKDAAELLEGMGILWAVTNHSNSKIIVSSRYRSVLLKMGVAEKHTITMENLSKDESWQLFSYHAFPYNNRSIPPNINGENAKLVCRRCGGLPLALKVVGRAMAGHTDPQEWKWAAQRLPNDDALDACLRLSYDALGKENIHLQLCFLYMAAAFGEDQIIHANHVIPLWVGEGLLARKDHHQLISYSPFAVGGVYLNLLADRCLIEPIVRSIEGFVVFFRIHNLLRDLGIRVAEAQETFFCRVGQGLSTLNEDECSGCSRIFLSSNQLCSLPKSMRVPELCSLLMDGNKCLTKIPKGVIGSMVSLKVLDLSGTSVQSLPESVGCLKQLRCLFLSGMPINLLPASLTNLGNLEILDISRSNITELPSGFHNLKSLRHLAMDKCGHLQYLPYSISRLTSLQGLTMYDCTNLWEKGEPKKWKKVATISNLANLKQLTRFHLTNNGVVIREGTLGNMTEMNTLMLELTKMTSLPSDMNNMSKLRRLYMECPDLVKMGSNFCAFQSMTSLILYKCNMLEELSHLHKLSNLERLEIIECSKLKKFPQEFGDKEAFSLLKIFSIVGLHELEELPILKEGAMPVLKTFIIVECSALKVFPRSYFDLKTLQIIKIYGCGSVIMENLRELRESNKMIEVKTMSVEDTRDSRKRYSQLMEEMKSLLYGEFWTNDVFLFSRSLYTLA